MNIAFVEDLLGRLEMIAPPEDGDFAAERERNPAESLAGRPIVHGWSS